MNQDKYKQSFRDKIQIVEKFVKQKEEEIKYISAKGKMVKFAKSIGIKKAQKKSVAELKEKSTRIIDEWKKEISIAYTQLNKNLDKVIYDDKTFQVDSEYFIRLTNILIAHFELEHPSLKKRDLIEMHDARFAYTRNYHTQQFPHPGRILNIAQIKQILIYADITDFLVDYRIRVEIENRLPITKLRELFRELNRLGNEIYTTYNTANSYYNLFEKDFLKSGKEIPEIQLQVFRDMEQNLLQLIITEKEIKSLQKKIEKELTGYLYLDTTKTFPIETDAYNASCFPEYEWKPYTELQFSRYTKKELETCELKYNEINGIENYRYRAKLRNAWSGHWKTDTRRREGRTEKFTVLQFDEESSVPSVRVDYNKPWDVQLTFDIPSIYDIYTKYIQRSTITFDRLLNLFMKKNMLKPTCNVKQINDFFFVNFGDSGPIFYFNKKEQAISTRAYAIKSMYKNSQLISTNTYKSRRKKAFGFVEQIEEKIMPLNRMEALIDLLHSEHIPMWWRNEKTKSMTQRLGLWYNILSLHYPNNKQATEIKRKILYFFLYKFQDPVITKNMQQSKICLINDYFREAENVIVRIRNIWNDTTSKFTCTMDENEIFLMELIEANTTNQIHLRLADRKLLMQILLIESIIQQKTDKMEFQLKKNNNKLEISLDGEKIHDVSV